MEWLSLGRVSIRLQLLIVALTTLVLPWAGCQYARELETALRSSQEQSLLASAGTIANALTAQPQRVFHDSGDSQTFSAAAGDLYVYPLVHAALLDGYREDWDVPGNDAAASSTHYHAGFRPDPPSAISIYSSKSTTHHFDAEPNNVQPDKDRFDRVNLTLQVRGACDLFLWHEMRRV